MWSAEQFRGKHHPRKLLHRFHALKGRSEIRPAGHNAVILEQDRIVFVHKRFQPRTEFPGARGSIGSQGNFAEPDDYFRKYWFFKSAPSSGKSGRSRRVGMADGSNIWPGPVVEKMH